jgi:hypothetical protein
VCTVLRLLLLVLLLGTSEASRADRLATYRGGGSEIVLMTDACKADGGSAQRAYRRAGRSRLEGCWSTNEAGNPVVTWRNGRVQELNQSAVRLAPKYAAMLRDIDSPDDQPPARRAFARPAWCTQASHAHERLICRDAELSTADLKLAPLWRSYRAQLSGLEQARTKSDYFRRLKSCGADKACIAGEQAAQSRVYREALGLQ